MNADKILPVIRNSQAKVYQHLREQIINFLLRPGERLKTSEIAVTLAVSRTPVREALGRLEQDGLVTRESGWGYIVKRLTIKEVRDVYKVREALEVEAVREAVECIDEETLGELEELLRKAKEHWENGRVTEFRKCTRLFYLTIVRVTENDALQDMIVAIDDRVRVLGAMLFNVYKERARESLIENGAVLDALRRRDIQEVEAAVRAHVSHARESLLRYMKHGDLKRQSETIANGTFSKSRKKTTV